MDELVIKNCNGTGRLRFFDRCPDDRLQPCEYFWVEVTNLNFSAALQVWVSGYAPSHPADLFAKMSKFWAGWLGEQTWESIEGELKLRCSRDTFGHIFILAEVRSGFMPHDWSASVTITTEAGQLDKIGVNAELFFGRES